MNATHETTLPYSADESKDAIYCTKTDRDICTYFDEDGKAKILSALNDGAKLSDRVENLEDAINEVLEALESKHGVPNVEWVYKRLSLAVKFE